MSSLIGLGHNGVMDSVVKTNGGTPIVRLSKLCSSRPDVKARAKLEGFNPVGRIKGRIALSMVEQADGILKPGATIREATRASAWRRSGREGLPCDDRRVRGRLEGAAEVPRGARPHARERRHRRGDPEVPQLADANPGKCANLDELSNAANLQAHCNRTAVEI
jgi:cysteine synthase